jgi:hypothetical protein
MTSTASTTQFSRSAGPRVASVEAATAASGRARMSADVEAPDRIVAGLTSRQVAVLAVVAATAYLGWRAVRHAVPGTVLVTAAVPVAGLTFALVMGRRDGLGLDVWLGHAARYARDPRRLLPARVPAAPTWAPPVATGRQPRVGVLRLPAAAIAADGVIRTGRSASVAVVAAATVNVGLRTAADQAGLVAGFASWLNGLTGPAQMVVAAHRVDLPARAVHVADTAQHLGCPALTTMAHEYARFLLDLAEARDPLARAVTVTVAGTGADASVAARRAADQAAAALAGLGTVAQVLDGPAVTALLTADVDPFGPGEPTQPRTPLGSPVSGVWAGERP